MKYKVNTLDGRFKYRKWFKYYIGFSTSMINDQGPMQFNRALQWFFDTYGWSAEIRQWSEIHRYQTKTVPLMSVKGGWVQPPLENFSEMCNPLWSWTDSSYDLRIYLASDAELMLFKLKFTKETTPKNTN